MSQKRLGIFGGTFNPPHNGHLHCVAIALQRLNLDELRVFPSAQNPLKPRLDGPTPEERLALCRAAFSEFGSKVVVDDREVLRGGKSYTIDTLQSLSLDGVDLRLLIGIDQFYQFDKWKNFEAILEIANLVVFSRNGFPIPSAVGDLPEGLQSLVAEIDRGYIQLKSGRGIEFLRMPSVDAAASEIRRFLKRGKSVDRYLPIAVQRFIAEHRLYQPESPEKFSPEQILGFCADFLHSKKAISVRGYDLRQRDAASDMVLIASGTSTRHTSAMAENLVVHIKESANLYPLSVEGTSEGRWVLIDYGFLIVHVFYDFVRNEYKIEELWARAPEIPLPEKLPPQG